MTALSDWYTSLADFTFPTMFVRLHEDEKSLLISGESNSEIEEKLCKRLEKVITALPGACFIGADTVTPDDSPLFSRKKSHAHAKTALELIKTSPKAQEEIKSGRSERIVVRPYRRMDKTREFRLFVFEGKLSGMSQRILERHFRRLEGRREDYWQKALSFTEEIVPFLDKKNVVIDIYFTSDGNVLIVDMNQWEECDPLLFRKWDRDWSEVSGLKLMSEPIKMQGDVKVSF
ncbi:MAG: hypothetical protein NE334_02175 [Lentisphaeraceae bacterium]|nr:hypothetical protein [Lentisphaeraceae bacterium]